MNDDDNYYEVSDECVIKNTGARIFPAPVFMQRVPTKKENKNFIQVGVQGFLPKKGEAKKESRPIFMRRTPELEAGYKRMIENFAKAIAPMILEKYTMYQQSDEYLVNFIKTQEELKTKKIEKLNKQRQRELERIEREHIQTISYAKKLLEERKTLTAAD